MTTRGPRPSPERRLAEYRSKRDFDVTTEPHGNGATPAPARDGSRFVVQRHRASRLHYDLRLEADGVLMSWAVPKGPTLDASARRLAVRVEDHPLDYFDFEGTIPASEYGGGDVIVWDWGTWSAADGTEPSDAIEAGELHFDVYGEKLRGRFALVRRRRRHGRDAGDSDRRDDDRQDDEWMLIHKLDAEAVVGWNPEDYPQSVKSGRTNDEVAAAPTSTWSADRRWRPVSEQEFEALAALPPSGGQWALDAHDVRVSNLDKVLFPGRDGHRPLTKRDLIFHYASVAPLMLPYLADRPINLHRYPDGVGEPGFWQKAVPRHAPSWVHRWRNDDADPGETDTYAVVDSPAALVWMANFGAVELHAWTSTAAHPTQPTWAMVDLDPGESTTLDELMLVARLHRTALEQLGVQAGAKVTGQRGIQVWIPVAQGYTFAETRTWVEQLSRHIGQVVPDLVSWEWRKDRRRGRMRLDYTQNAVNKTLVAPFSVRPAPGAPVSVPITWDELDDPDLRPDRWTIDTVAERLATSGDPLAPLRGLQQQLPEF